MLALGAPSHLARASVGGIVIRHIFNGKGTGRRRGMSVRPIVYMGDTSLGGAAGYLAGLMTSFGYTFDYLPSELAAGADVMATGRRLFILSDYPAKNLVADHQHGLLAQVRDTSAGLLMIGGWESYCGHGGDWAGTPVAEAL